MRSKHLHLFIISILALFLLIPSNIFAGISSFANLSVESDPHSGSANFGVPIEVPSGRGGIQPNVALQYNSSLPNGILGVGWNMEFGSVQRSTKKGSLAYDDMDTFILVQNGSAQELIKDSSTGLYHAKAEGAFMRIERTGGYWLVTDKSGTKYYFGEALSNREYDPVNSSKVYRWCLNKVEDIHGNYMTFDYLKDNNKNYPSNIYYTGNSQNSSPTFAKVSFIYESRSEGDLVRYAAGFRQALGLRLKNISTYVDNNLQRRYDIGYSQSIISSRSLLTSVTQFGNDGITSLPAVTFSYQGEGGLSYDLLTFTNSVNGLGDNLWNYRMGGNYDRGHDNFGSVPAGAMDVNWSSTYTQSSGSTSNSNWSTSNGGLTFSANQDSAHWFWTYLYVNQAKTINIPFTGGGNKGVYLNGNYGSSVGNSWSLNQGYNLVEITDYHQHESFNWNMNYALASNVDVMNSSKIIGPQYAGDFNADTFTDIARFDEGSGTVKVMRSSGSGFANEETWISNFGTNGKFLLGDFNGDGRNDVGSFIESSGIWNIALSDGTQFIDSGTWLSGFGANEKQSTADIDGDGLTDILTFYTSGSTLYARIALNQGGSFFASGEAISIGTGVDQAFTADFNGDGKIDFGCFDAASGTWRFHINTGDNTTFTALTQISGFGANKSMVVSDFNSDGMTDIGYYDYANGNVIARYSQGESFAPSTTISFGFDLRDSFVQIQSADFNGDAMVDYVAYNVGGVTEIAFSQGESPDVMSSIDNGHGGTTSISYQSATANCVETFLPFPIKVVSSITKSTNLGDQYTTNMIYKMGLWDVDDREFRGFNSVKTIDPQGSYTKTYYLQDDVYKGRVSSQETYDSADNLYSKTVNTWDIINDIYPGSDFIYLKRKDNYVYDGDAIGRRTAEEFYYEEITQLGNLTKAIQLGEVDLNTGTDIIGDSRTVETSYIKNITNWLIGLPNQVIVKDTNNTVVRQTWFNYDSQANISAPLKGLLTSKDDWFDGATNPTTQYTYDSYGNLKTTIDPLNNTTSITYDSTYNIFPLSTSNAIGHSVNNQYYGVNGVSLNSGGYSGLWGQLKGTTDPNDNQGLKSYDIFGRVVSTVSPLDSITYPTTLTEYSFTNSIFSVTTRNRIKSGDVTTIDSFSYYDGLGRLFLTTKRSAVDGQYTVAGQTQYNSRGLPQYKYLPYFTANVFEVIDETRPRTFIEYDAMGRVIKSTQPSGYYSTVEYNDWSTATINENGHKQESRFDAYGRLIHKLEYTGADGRAAAFYPTTAYLVYANTYYNYDSEGNLIQTTDAHNNITTITYDSLGRKISMNDPDMGVWNYNYDLNGNLISQTDAKNQTITFTYDILNRLTNKTDGAGLNTDYTYDDPFIVESKGRLTQASYGANDKTAFSYDSLGREIQSTKTIDSRIYSVGREYDALNRLINVQYPDQEKIEYQYNPAGQIKAISNETSIMPAEDQNTAPDPEPLSKIKTILAPLQYVFTHIIEPYVLGVKTAEAMGYLPGPDDVPMVVRLETAEFGPVINLTWSMFYSGNVEGYYVRYKKINETNYIKIDAGNVMTSAIAGLEENTYYNIIVNAYNSAGEGPSSFEWTIFTPSSSGHLQTINTVEMSFLLNGFIYNNNNGYLVIIEDSYTERNIDLPKSGVYNIALNTFASIDLDPTSPPIIEVFIDGNLIDSTSPINYKKYNNIQFEISEPGSHQLKINFRNVYIPGKNIYVYLGDTVTLTEIVSEVPIVVPTVSFTVNPTTIIAGDSTTLTWSSTDADTCTASNGWTGAKTTSGTEVLSPTANTTYVLTCTGSGGTAVQSVSIVVNQPPPPSSPTLNIITSAEGQVDLGWSSVTGATGYKVHYGTTSGAYTTTLDVSNVTTHSVTGLTNGTTYYFAVTAYNANGESVNSNELNAAPTAPVIPPTATLTANPQTITEGESTTLTWSSTDADTCTASNGWSGSKVTSGSEVVSPIVNTIYTLTCTGVGGNVVENLSITVNLVINSTGLISSWNFDEGSGTIANDVSGSNNNLMISGASWDIGKINGALTFSETTDYTIKNSMVNFPTIEISTALWIKTIGSEEGIISYASSAANNNEWLIFDSSNLKIHRETASIYTGVSINDGIWNHVVVTWRSSDGQTEVYKNGSIAYSGVFQAGSVIDTQGSLVIGQDQDNVGGGFDSTQAFLGQLDEVKIYSRVLNALEIQDLYEEGVSLVNAPTATLTANPLTIISGQSTTLTWSSTDADTCTASNGWSGAKTISGSEIFSPTVNTTYILTCSGAGGSKQENIIITVSPPSSTGTVYISSDNSYEFYFNGVLEGVGSSWMSAGVHSVQVISGENVVAIKGVDAGGVAALLVEVQENAQRIGSSIDTKVSLSESVGWQEVNFDDSGWTNATDYGAYGISPWLVSISGFPIDTPAHWIWSSDNSNNNEVYVRLTFNSGVINQLPSSPVFNIITAGNAQVDLSWNTVTDATGYNVKYGTAPGVYDITIDVANITTHSVIGLINGTTYYFSVSAYNANGESVNSNELNAAPTAPVIPSTVTLIANPLTIISGQSTTLTWSSTDADTCTASNGWSGAKAITDTENLSPTANITYTLTCTGVGGTAVQNVFVTVNPAPTFSSNSSNYGLTTFSLDSAGATGQSSSYNLSYSTLGESINGEIQNANTYVYIGFLSTLNNASRPSAPLLNNATLGDTKIDLAWDPVSNATGYKVKYGTTSSIYETPIDVGNVTNYSVLGLTNGTPYYFAVSAYNTEGQSGDSNELNFIPNDTFGQTPIPPTIDLSSSLTTITDEETITLTWSTTNADTCIASDGWTGARATSGTEILSPLEDTTYLLTCTGTEGVAAQKVFITVNPAPPIEESNTAPTLIVKNIEYNPFGQITQIEYGNGTITTNTYDPLSIRLTNITTVDAVGTILQDLTYQYDPAGNILDITDGVNTASQQFTYDHLNRLETANNSSTYGYKIYIYDEIGNIIEKDGKTYTYDQIAGGVHAVTETDDGVTRTTYTYDNNGNMQTKQIIGGEFTQYSYDIENRLINIVKDGTTTADYKYDGDGGRVKKDTANGITRFIGSLYEETGASSATHIYLGSTKIATIRDDKIKYSLHDHLGGTNVVTDDTGAVEEIIEYQPFGKKERHDNYVGGAVSANHYFTGHFEDEESGLIFMKGRYYDPELGRFITADVVAQNPDGNPQTLNRYSYTGNNPINRIDPSGHIFGVLFAIGKAIFAAVKAWSAAHTILASIAGGALLGGVTSAAMGGNIGMGMLTGAISGFAFGGIASLGYKGFFEAGAHALAGVASGGINAVITGGDPIKGALVGGVSAGVSMIGAFKGGNFLKDVTGRNLKAFAGNFIKRSVIGAVVGGTINVAFGQSFETGAAQGATASGISYMAKWLNYKASGKGLKVESGDGVSLIQEGPNPSIEDGGNTEIHNNNSVLRDDLLITPQKSREFVGPETNAAPTNIYGIGPILQPDVPLITPTTIPSPMVPIMPSLLMGRLKDVIVEDKRRKTCLV